MSAPAAREGLLEQADHREDGGPGVDPVAGFLDHAGAPAGDRFPLDRLRPRDRARRGGTPPTGRRGRPPPRPCARAAPASGRARRRRCRAPRARRGPRASIGATARASRASLDHAARSLRSTSSTAPGLDEHRLQAGDLGVVEVGPAEVLEPARRRPGRRGAAAAATSGVSLPSRRSSPTGLPVTAASPNTPRMSSRSWKASPSGSPNALSGVGELVEAARPAPRRDAAAARRCTSRTCSARSEPPAPGRCCRWPCPTRSRYWPTQSSIRSSSKTGRAISGAERSKMSAYTNAKSPTRIAAPSPNRRASPRHRSDVVAGHESRGGSPGDLDAGSDPSMTSSCTSANVCSSSSAAPASTTTGSSCAPPAPTNAQ